MRYRELIRKNAPLTLFATSGTMVLQALRRAERVGLGRIRPRERIYTVEINKTAEEIPTEASRWPAALTALAVETVDVRVDPTPGRNTMRLRATSRPGHGGRRGHNGHADNAVLGDLGRRVRETKQLLETGEVLRSPAVPSGDGTAGDRR